MSWNKIIECVPNFSEGRDLEKIDQNGYYYAPSGKVMRKPSLNVARIRI